MSLYTTGEISNLANVSVRTIQYYDKKGILKPVKLSEGRRRLYDEESLKDLNLICLLKSIGLSLKQIKEIIGTDIKDELILDILDEQTKILKKEEKDILQKLNSIKLIKNSVLDKKNLPVNSLKDIETIMKRNNQLKKVHINMVIIGILMDIITIGTLLFWIIKGIWLPFIFGIIIVIILGLISFRLYYNNILYICPKCKDLFKPTIFKFLFSYHTPKTRKLTCPKCQYKGYMVETYDEK